MKNLRNQLKIPQFLETGEDILFETDFENADLCLYDILPALPLNGKFNIRINDTAMECYCVYFKHLEMTALYIDTHMPLMTVGKDALLRISRLQYGPDLAPYGVIDQEDIIRHALHCNFSISKKEMRTHGGKKNCKSLIDWFKGEREVCDLKVSARHLKHFTKHEVRKLGLSFFTRVDYLFPFLSSMIDKGMHESMLVGLLIWANLLPNQAHEWSRRSGIWWWKYKSVDDFSNRVKKYFSLRLKAVQNIIEMDLAPFFELEVLVNRGIGKVDWKQERKNRTEPVLAEFEEQDIYNTTVELFRKINRLGGKVQKSRWESHWKKRWQWAPTGAYHSQYKEDDQYKAESQDLKNKLYSFCRMPNLSFEHFNSRKPSIVAWPSTKYEWGKQRAIYGVDITNFIMSSFGMAGCENYLETVFPIGSTAQEKYVQNSVKETLRNGVPFCFDYEDFNSQHSVGSMKAVLLAYRDVNKNDLTQEQVRSIDWLIESLEDCVVIEGENKTYKVKGTLLSGWRITTFMNTVLNYVYLKSSSNVGGSVSLHNGDDVLAAVKDIRMVQNIQKGARRHNLRFQSSKCFLGAIAEFLRVDHKKGDGTQYLARGVSTLVHGPTETNIPTDLRQILSSNKTRMTEVRQRGAREEVLRVLEDIQDETVSRLWDTELSDIKIVKQTHLSKGGLNEQITRESLSYRVRNRVLRKVKNEKTNRDIRQELPGTADYAAHICGKLGVKQYIKEVAKAARKAVLSNSTVTKYGVMILKETVDDIDLVKASKWNCLRSYLSGAKVLLAKAYGIPISALGIYSTKIGILLKAERNLTEALKIML